MVNESEIVRERLSSKSCDYVVSVLFPYDKILFKHFKLMTKHLHRQIISVIEINCRFLEINAFNSSVSDFKNALNASSSAGFILIRTGFLGSHKRRLLLGP
jgi:hypothetical protein